MYTENDIRRYKKQLDFAMKMDDSIKIKYLEKKIDEAQAYIEENERRLRERLQQEERELKENQERNERIKAHSWTYQRSQLIKAGITPIWYTYKVVFFSETSREQLKELYYRLKSDMNCMNTYTGTYGGLTFEALINKYNLDHEELNDAGYIDYVEEFSNSSDLSDEEKQKLIIEAITDGISIDNITNFSNGFNRDSFYTVQKVIQNSFLEIWDALLAQEFPGVKYKIEQV